MLDIAFKEKKCIFNAIIQPSEMPTIHWPSFVKQFKNTYWAKYGIIKKILTYDPDNYGEVKQNGSISINITCLCHVIFPEINDIISFDITNILEDDGLFSHESDLITIGLDTDESNNNNFKIGSIMKARIKSFQFVDDKYFIIAQPIF